MAKERRELPSGVVTFLFTDVEGSTRLLHELGPDVYGQALAEHRPILGEFFGAYHGVEVDTQGDAFFFVFSNPSQGMVAATQAQDALSAGPIRVRIGLHTGQPVFTEESYVGLEVHRGARMATAAHGGHVVLSRETCELIGDAFPVTDLGERRVKGFAEPVWLFQLGHESFPPLRTTLAARAEMATRLVSFSEVLREEVGANEGGAVEFNEQTVAVVHSRPDEAAFAEKWELGRKLTGDEAVALALEQGS